MNLYRMGINYLVDSQVSNTVVVEQTLRQRVLSTTLRCNATMNSDVCRTTKVGDANRWYDWAVTSPLPLGDG